MQFNVMISEKYVMDVLELFWRTEHYTAIVKVSIISVATVIWVNIRWYT